MLHATLLTIAWQAPLAVPAPPSAAVRCPSPVLWVDLTDDAKRLTDAQIARTVASVSGSDGVLCTQLDSEVMPGGGTFPCPVPFIVDGDGCPMMPVESTECLSNLQASKMATFYARAPRGGAAASSVVTLIGDVEDVPVDDVDDAQLMDASKISGETTEALAARSWVRLVPSRVHVFDAVRSAEAWVPPAEYAEAEPNPLAPAAATLLSKMNTQHAPALRRFAAVYAGVPSTDLASAELLNVDQMGFDLRMQLGPSAPTSLVRAGFKMPPANEEEGTSIFMKLFQEAYERENGSMA